VGFYQNITILVEEAVERSGRPAVLITHSMGGLVIGGWLAHMSRSWRDKHVAAFVPISAPFGGSVSAVLGERLHRLVLPALYCKYALLYYFFLFIFNPGFYCWHRQKPGFCKCLVIGSYSGGASNSAALTKPCFA
jgi:alpha-beta hydrolase superfamily lysophospholipase